MRESILMRVLFCKIHCPFICFCKPSAGHLYNPGPLKLENTRNASPIAVSGSDHLSCETAEVKEQISEAENVLRSCIRKEPNGAHEKKRVQWVDNMGKQLAEIKEYESSETGDTDNDEESRGCVCTIL